MMGLLIFVFATIGVCFVPLIQLILRDEDKAAKEAERQREWEAEAIMRRLQGKAPPLRPGYTNSPGPM